MEVPDDEMDFLDEEGEFEQMEESGEDETEPKADLKGKPVARSASDEES